MVCGLFSSSSKSLSLEDALELANEQLNSARKAKSPARKLQLCQSAKSMIKNAEKIVTDKKVKNPALKDSIAIAYHEHGKLLDELGNHIKAQRSYNKAAKWGYTHGRSQHIDSRQSPPDALSTKPHNMDGSIRQSPPAILSPTPDVALTKPQEIPVSGGVHEPREAVALIPKRIFDQNVAPPVAKYDLPEILDRITSTPQLAYCLSLLNPSMMSKEQVDEIEYDWSQARINDPDEQERLQTMATNVIRVFARDELKKPDVVAEVVSLTAVLDRDDFRKLLQILVDGIDGSLLLEIHLLDGLAQLMRNAPQGYLDADDLVKILNLLNARLKDTHKQSIRNIHQLALATSRVLDSMVDSQVKGLSRELLHEPLSDYLKGLQGSSDSYLVFQAVYAYQALQYVPDDESVLQAVLRRTGKVVRGISGMVSAVKALDLNSLIEGLQDIQGGLAAAGSVISLAHDAYSQAKTLVEGGQGLLEGFKEGLSFTRKSTWYPALRGLDRLLQEGRFSEFERLIREAPCRLDPAFQWGVCQRLGELATNTAWDPKARECAVIFLGELYKDDTTWGPQASIKQWVLVILNQVVDSSTGITVGQAQALLCELETNGGAEKRAMYQAFKNGRVVSYPMMVTLPPQKSPLLDIVQNKPDVDTPLSRLRRDRLKGQGEDIYISPRAKASLRAKEDFDLAHKVQEFLNSDRKVLLLLGDSGAGKSTFNRNLEIDLWKVYKKIVGRIPLFVHLPTIDKPEHNLIDKQLRKLNFTEEQIRELKSYREFILICDGYDESPQTRNLYVSNHLNQPGEWRAQMVISCRTEYTGIDYIDRFQPTDRNNRGCTGLFQEAVIMPFNKIQIHDFIDQYVSSGRSSWKPDDYKRALREIRNLQDLVTNPFLLRLALEVLPDIVDTRSDFSMTRITRVGLYDGFIAQWLERGKKRLVEMDLDSKDKETFQKLSLSGFSLQGFAFLKEFTTAIYDHQDGNPVVNYPDPHGQKAWKETFFNANDEKSLLIRAMPLVCSGIVYRFIHKSVLEYGLALAVFDPNSIDEIAETTPTPRRGSVSSDLSFEIQDKSEEPVRAIEQSLLDSPLGRKNLVGEPSIIRFLVERVQQQPTFKDQLLAIIERSKTDKMVRTAAINAITILVRAGVHFNGADLRGINVPGADLSYGVFDSAQLEGSDLRKANLQSAWLRQAKLDRAQMKGVRFGELPFLQESSITLCCAYSPDGKTFAVGTMDGDLSLYETLSWDRVWSSRAHSRMVMRLAFSVTSDQIATGGDDETAKLWDVKSGTCTHTLCHKGCVNFVAFSPNGSQVASGSDDNTTRLWDLDTGECTHALQGHSAAVVSVAYSPKGDQIASASLDKTVRLWNVDTGECVHNLQGHKRIITCIAYSPKGNLIASGSRDKTVQLWDVETGDCIHTLSHNHQITSLTYSHEGDRIASGSRDMTVKLWNVDTGDCIHTFQGHSKEVTRVVYSPNGDQIASASADKTVRLWDVGSGDCIQTLQGHDRDVVCLVYSPNGRQVASGSWDMTVRLWDVNTNADIHNLQGHGGAVNSVVCSPKGDQIASGSWDGTVRLWDVDTGNPNHILQGHRGYFTSVAFSPKGDQIAAGIDDEIVRLWDVKTGNCVQTLRRSTAQPEDLTENFDIIVDLINVSSAVYSPKGDRIASGRDGLLVRLWDVNTGDLIRTFNGHTYDITCVVYSPNGDQIASGSNDQTVRLWDVETGECIHTLNGHDGSFHSVVYSPKGDQIASGSVDMTVRLWDVKTGERIHDLQGHSNHVNIVVYSPRGDRIASGSWDGTVRLWNVETGDSIHTLEGHSDYISSVSFSPKGDHIASGSCDMTVRLWDVETGQYLVTIPGFTGRIYSIAWGATLSGQYLVTGSEDKSVRRWQIIKERDEYKALLCWSSSHGTLTVPGTSLCDVIDLDRLNSKLLTQRGALVTASPLAE
ncbi:hypothetical protein BGZ79_001156 [Entomortierella chlamydospora]|nr:hypothetical protein BGZ79_001156 [Entomortierella chlamydospora]